MRTFRHNFYNNKKTSKIITNKVRKLTKIVPKIFIDAFTTTKIIIFFCEISLKKSKNHCNAKID